MFKDLLHKSLVLMLVAGFAGLLLSVTYSFTAPYIEKSKLEAKLLAEKEVGGTPQEVIVKGYGGDINMLVGVSDEGAVTGVKVLSMLETPGLGALASNPEKLKGRPFSFLGQFIGSTIASKLRAKEDIVAITGATITSQAIADGVSLALKKVQRK
ncbi:MAG: FMN-binding protein [Candidatus Margulisiibacteriota bacterium]